MATINSTVQSAKTSLRKVLGRDNDLAVLGNESGAVFVDGNPGYVWVRPVQAGGTLGKSYRVRGPLVPMQMTPGTPVNLTTSGHEKQIAGINFESALAQGVNPTQSAVVDPNANNPGFVNQAFIATAYQQIVAGTLKVGIRGSVPLVAGVFVKVEGQLDFTGNVPSSGNHCLAVTAVLSNLSGFEVQYSTAKSVRIPLTIDDLNEAWALMSAPLTNKPLWSWELSNGQTALVEANRWMDNRQFLNWESSGGGSGTVTSVSAGTGLTATPNPIVGAGTISVDGSIYTRIWWGV